MNKSQAIGSVLVTPEEMSREALAMTKAETARRQRLRSNAVQAGEKCPEFDKTPRRIAADRLGVGVATVQRGCSAVQALDAAEESGDTEKASTIRKAFRTSISTAYNVHFVYKDSERPKPEPSECRDPFTKDWSDSVRLARALTKRVAAIGPMVDELEIAHGGPSCYSRDARKAVRDATEKIQAWCETLEKLHSRRAE